ncbi:hypothetical protein [Bradyrhizobium sp. 6(2017)]|uniref:hypothetical protein n=1 Tax=Bradyrhizobium sp. 6(2017) TaxID=1197460 RepID=UPI0013E11341|nr:hypothetical protein [Bradyrhizobium sp. 6(2017)]QIG98168.1 hypothetical protein G6P99_42230 [Bradyrhizobium sp. 6(2017)]
MDASLIAGRHVGERTEAGLTLDANGVSTAVPSGYRQGYVKGIIISKCCDSHL